jgi:hypothetical protein
MTAAAHRILPGSPLPALGHDIRLRPLHALLRDAMAPHLGVELAHERAAALLSALDTVRSVHTPDGVAEVTRIVFGARALTSRPGRWVEYPRPTLAACELAAQAACAVLGDWAAAEVA